MALSVTYLNEAQSITASATLGVTGITAAVGDILVICVAAYNAGTDGVSSISSVSDGTSNSYTLGSNTYDPGAAAAGATASLIQCKLTNALSNATVTINFSPNTTCKAAHIYKITGSNPAVDSPYLSTQTGSNTTPSSYPGYSIPSGYVIFSVAAIETDDAVTSYDTDTTSGSWSTGRTLCADGGNDASAMSVVSQYKITTGSGLQSWEIVLGTARDWATSGVVFKEGPKLLTSNITSISDISIADGKWFHNLTSNIISTTRNGSSPVIKTVCGQYFTAVLKANGDVHSWGNNIYGQCNHTDTNSPAYDETTVRISGCIDIAAGVLHIVALKANGDVHAWGDNSEGQCNHTNATTPVYDYDTVRISDCKAIACGGLHTIVLKNNGDVHTWGYNSYGQCNHTNTSTPAYDETTVRISGCKAIAAGYGHTVVLKNNGDVHAWGHNFYGQCNHTNTTSPAYDETTVRISGVKAIAAGAYHTIVLKENGDVHAWGRDNNGQCDHTDTTSSPAYDETTVRISGCKAIAAGSYHTIVLKENGDVHSWGNNIYGQCNHTDTNSPAYDETTVRISGCIDIAGGGYHTIVLKENGDVHTWGYNSEGQCNHTNATSPAYDETTVRFSDSIATYQTYTYNFTSSIVTSSALSIIDIITVREIAINIVGSSSLSTVDGTQTTTRNLTSNTNVTSVFSDTLATVFGEVILISNINIITTTSDATRYKTAYLVSNIDSDSSLNDIDYYIVRNIYSDVFADTYVSDGIENSKVVLLLSSISFASTMSVAYILDLSSLSSYINAYTETSIANAPCVRNLEARASPETNIDLVDFYCYRLLSSNILSTSKLKFHSDLELYTETGIVFKTRIRNILFVGNNMDVVNLTTKRNLNQAI